MLAADEPRRGRRGPSITDADQRHHHPASHRNRLDRELRRAMPADDRPAHGFAERRAEDDITQEVPIVYQLPVKSGLPSVVRGICPGFYVAVFCADSGVSTVNATRAIISNSQRAYRSVMSPSLFRLLIRGRA